MDVFARLLRSHASLTRTLSAQLLAEHGLTLNDYEALLHLSHADGQRMRRVDLADSLLLTASGVTRLLDGLESCGLVARDTCPSDRRVAYAVLTDAGRERLEAASSSHLAAIASTFQGRFSDAELVELADLLGRLPGAGGEDGSACSPPE